MTTIVRRDAILKVSGGTPTISLQSTLELLIHLRSCLLAQMQNVVRTQQLQHREVHLNLLPKPVSQLDTDERVGPQAHQRRAQGKFPVATHHKPEQRTACLFG